MEAPSIAAAAADNTRLTLIERIKQRYDDAAWREFAEIYRGYIYAVIRNLNLSEHDAEEIHQRVMVKLWEKLPSLEVGEIRRFRSYLAGVVKNEVKQFIRSQTRRQNRETRVAEDEADGFASIRLPEIEVIAEAEWKVHLTNVALQNIAKDFSQTALEVFRLSIEGLLPEEIATRTGVGRGSVATLKARVKTRFFQEIDQLRADLDGVE
ncbi:MAG: hypothetical protein SynsKO_27320 [Synoicihabitans sp.]